MTLFGFMSKKTQEIKIPHLSTDDVRSFLKPFIRKDIWLTDTQYAKIDSKTALEFLKKVQLKDRAYIPNLFECEEFSLVALAKLREYRALLFDEGDIKNALNLPIGMCSGTMFKGVKFNHTLIVCACSDGVFLFEPQSGEMWLAQQGKDKFFFIWM